MKLIHTSCSSRRSPPLTGTFKQQFRYTIPRQFYARSVAGWLLRRILLWEEAFCESEKPKPSNLDGIVEEFVSLGCFFETTARLIHCCHRNLTKGVLIVTFDRLAYNHTLFHIFIIVRPSTFSPFTEVLPPFVSMFSFNIICFWLIIPFSSSLGF